MNAVEKFLPTKVVNALNKLDESRIYEIRLRLSGVSVNYGGKFFGLSDVGIGAARIKLTAAEIEDIVLKASGYSIYAVNDQIKNGFLSLSGGVRMGICGEVVGGKTIKNFTSLNIRFPHEIKGCADKVIKFVARDRGCYNTLIISPPGCGKTTLLRDLIRQISNKGSNVLVADERCEIAGGCGALDVGPNTDIISGGTKSFAFNQGIRYMRPDVLAADELMTDEDMASIKRACAGGVSVIASLHASGEDYKRTFYEPDLIERIVVLADKGGPGYIEGIFDGKYGRIA